MNDSSATNDPKDASHAPSAPSPSASEAASEAAAAEGGVPVDDVAWQKLWIATQRRPWRSLAIVPSSAAIDTLSIARTLAAIGQRHLGRKIEVLDVRTVPIHRIEETKTAVAARTRRNEFAILALDPITESASSLALAISADVALLAVLLRATSIEVAEKIIEEVGPDRFLGSFVLHAHRP